MRKRGSVPMAENMSAYRTTASPGFTLPLAVSYFHLRRIMKLVKRKLRSRCNNFAPGTSAARVPNSSREASQTHNLRIVVHVHTGLAALARRRHRCRQNPRGHRPVLGQRTSHEELKGA